jgi:hypothetical protein
MDFFKRLFRQGNVLLPPETDSTDPFETEPLPELKDFSTAVMATFSVRLVELGFELTEHSVRNHFADFTWRKYEHYLQLGASTYPTDHPFPLKLRLGIGKDDGEESAFNSIPLWHLIQDSNEVHREDLLLFPFANCEAHLSELLKATESLGMDFFTGTADHFIERRKLYVQERGPFSYTIQDWQGNTRQHSDEKSIALWKKYC